MASIYVSKAEIIAKSERMFGAYPAVDLTACEVITKKDGTQIKYNYHLMLTSNDQSYEEALAAEKGDLIFCKGLFSVKDKQIHLIYPKIEPYKDKERDNAYNTPKSKGIVQNKPVQTSPSATNQANVKSSENSQINKPDISATATHNNSNAFEIDDEPVPF